MPEQGKEKRLSGETPATSSSDDVITKNVETLRREIEATAGIVDATVEVLEPHLIGGGAPMSDSNKLIDPDVVRIHTIKTSSLDPLESDTGIIIFEERQGKIKRKKAT